jgi:hypothetical protein
MKPRLPLLSACAALVFSISGGAIAAENIAALRSGKWPSHP